jgi:hypothetical protein
MRPGISCVEWTKRGSQNWHRNRELRDVQSVARSAASISVMKGPVSASQKYWGKAKCNEQRHSMLAIRIGKRLSIFYLWVNNHNGTTACDA